MVEDRYNNDYLSIKEFSEFAGLTKHTLRYYDRAGIFHPARLGVASENKYRYYSKEQIITIKMIHLLTEIGVPLETIRELEEYRTPEILLKLFWRCKNDVLEKIRSLYDICAVIDTYIDLLCEGITATENEITVLDMPAERMALGELNEYNGADDCSAEYNRFCSAAHEPKLNMSFPIGGYWGSMDDFTSEPMRPARFYSLDPKGHDEKAEGLYLNGYSLGNRNCMCEAAAKMEAFAKETGLEFTGPVYVFCLFDEISVIDPEQYLLQISAAVKETRRAPPRKPHRL